MQIQCLDLLAWIFAKTNLTIDAVRDNRNNNCEETAASHKLTSHQMA